MIANTQSLRELSAISLESARIRAEMIAIAADRIDAQAAEIERLRAALTKISEYWNRDQNDQAMLDACWYSINTADAALLGERKINEVTHGAT